MVHICYQLGLRVGTRIFKRNSCLLVFYCVKLNFLVKIKTHVCFLLVFGIIKCWFCFVLREIECSTISTTGDLTYHKSHRREFEWGAGKHRIVSSMWGPVLKWIIIKFSWRSFIFLFTNQRQLDSSEFFLSRVEFWAKWNSINK